MVAIAIATQKLHIGCGRKILEGWVNLDLVALPGVDVAFDLETCGTSPLPFEDDTFEEMLASHVIEHVSHTLPMMQELHRVAKPGCRAEFHVPYGSNDDAFEDPTHVRQYFLGSFHYFSQPHYWRADYGYRGDWDVEQITLMMKRSRYGNCTPEQVMEAIRCERNSVREMHVVMRAIKPIRPPLRELQRPPNVTVDLV